MDETETLIFLFFLLNVNLMALPMYGPKRLFQSDFLIEWLVNSIYDVVSESLDSTWAEFSDCYSGFRLGNWLWAAFCLLYGLTYLVTVQ